MFKLRSLVRLAPRKNPNSLSVGQGRDCTSESLEFWICQSCACGHASLPWASLGLLSVFEVPLSPYLLVARRGHSWFSVEASGDICPHSAAVFCHCRHPSVRSNRLLPRIVSDLPYFPADRGQVQGRNYPGSCRGRGNFRERRSAPFGHSEGRTADCGSPRHPGSTVGCPWVAREEFRRWRS